MRIDARNMKDLFSSESGKKFLLGFMSESGCFSPVDEGNIQTRNMCISMLARIGFLDPDAMSRMIDTFYSDEVQSMLKAKVRDQMSRIMEYADGEFHQ